ncbi:hypothetical protein EBX93_03090, partial [bacterium]|nr:hypothetical protein [bacterium]
IIPTQNPTSIVGYYLGVFSLIPIFGLILTIPAFICGIIAVQKAMANPKVAGMGHAITAIVLSVVQPIILIALILLGLLKGF